MFNISLYVVVYLSPIYCVKIENTDRYNCFRDLRLTSISTMGWGGTRGEPHAQLCEFLKKAPPQKYYCQD